MSAKNVTALKTHLTELLGALERFDHDLDKDFAALDARWHRLDAAWDGYAYQEFQSSWNGARHTMKQYIDLSKRYEKFLRERIEYLEKFERSEGLP